MKFRLAAVAAIAGAMLIGCTTTEEAQQVIQSRWVGQPIELFFTQYGPPYSQFPMQSGSVIYTWRGGDATRYIPATYTTPTQPDDPVIGRTTTTTKTTETKKGEKVTKTTTTSVSIAAPAPQPQMISPPRYEKLFCELQITADTTQHIVAIRATNDTDGEGMSFSRCAEVLNAHPDKK